jgi:hypothetical protein
MNPAMPDYHSALKKEIAAYNARREELQKASHGKWVVFHDCQLEGVFGDFQEAATTAVEKFGRGPYLIRQIGSQEEVVLPMSVVCAAVYEAN